MTISEIKAEVRQIYTDLGIVDFWMPELVRPIYHIRRRALLRKMKGLPPEPVPSWEEINNEMFERLNRPSPYADLLPKDS